MQVSAINLNNSFKGYYNNDVIDVQADYVKPKSFDEVMDRIDLKKVADEIQKVPENKATSPIKFFLTTALLTIASFAATKRISQATLKSLEGKLSLDKPLNRLGEKVYNKLSSSKAKQNIDIKNFKTFFESTYNKTTKWLAECVENIGKKGVLEAEETAYRTLMGEKAIIGGLYAKNAMRKMVSTILATGVAGVTATARNKDKDGNGIPDCAEDKNVLGTIKAVADILPGIDSAINFAA